MAYTLDYTVITKENIPDKYFVKNTFQTYLKCVDDAYSLTYYYGTNIEEKDLDYQSFI